MVNESWKSPQDWFLTNSYSVPYFYSMLNNLSFKFRLVYISTLGYMEVRKILYQKMKKLIHPPYAISRLTADFYLKSLNKEFSFNFVGTRQQIFMASIKIFTE